MALEAVIQRLNELVAKINNATKINDLADVTNLTNDMLVMVQDPNAQANEKAKKTTIGTIGTLLNNGSSFQPSTYRYFDLENLYTYNIGLDDIGNWYASRYNANTGNTTYARQTNNSTITTIAQANTNYLTLTYV